AFTYQSKYFLETIVMGDIDQKGPRGTNECAFQCRDGFAAIFARGALCDSWEMVDPLTIRLHVRQGVKWQDNPRVMASRALTADDIVFSLTKMAKAPKSVSRFTFVDSITAPDKNTVVIKCNTYNSIWLYLLGYYYYAQIWPPEMEKAGASDWRNAVGTGPFIVKDYVRGSMRVYARNPNYWDTTTINGKKYQLPFVDEIKYPIIPDEATRNAALRVGRADLDTNVNWPYKDTLAKTNPEMTRFSYMYTEYFIAMRMDIPPFNDIKVRRALNMAIDHEALLKALVGGEGSLFSFPFQTFYPEFTQLKDYPDYVQELFTYNPEKAKQLLAEAGYPNGFKTEMNCGNIGALVQGPSLAVDYWSKIGVNCELKSYEYAILATMVYGKQVKQMTVNSGGGALWLNSLASYCITKGTLNTSFYSDSVIDEAFDKASSTTNPVEEAAALKKANERYVELVPVIWLAAPMMYQYCWPWVKNWYGEVSAGQYAEGPIVARMWVDQALKNKMGH
ncbi:MAG: ABC transporter substrate-binding protein, partial [Dehalococcoidales bacterium]|nr:ABC transporter substrate-binding protein [Dehalococcoidales bacterium]